MSEEILLEARGISRSFHGRQILYGVNIKLHRGEVLGLLGPNGAGKSTTLKILTGVLAPESGSVHICGIDLHSNPTQAKAGLGYLPEEAPLYLDQTVQEYLSYCARLRRVSDESCAAAVARVTKDCDLTDVSGRLIANLSKGYKQRVGIAQALVHEPKVLILDEPTNGLDPNQIRDVRNLIRSLSASQALIISTHILSEAQTLCDSVVIMHRGKIAHQQMRSHTQDSLNVVFSNPPPTSFFEQLVGVTNSRALAADHFLVTVSDHEAAAHAIVQKSVTEDLGLLELSPRGSALEELFVEITCNDSSHLVDD